MSKVRIVDLQRSSVGLSRGLELQEMPNRPGPPPSLDGVTVGYAEMASPPPHKGERHPDGDELLIVVSGRLRVLPDNGPEEGIEVGEGQACIVPKGEWHRVKPLGPVRLIFITPGPNNEFRG